MRPHVAQPVLYSAFVIATTLLTGVLVQPLTRRVGPRADLLGLGAGVLGLLLAARAVTAGSPGPVFAVAVLAGAGYGLVMTTGLIEIGQRVPAQTRGTTVGIYYVLTYIGFALPFIHATEAKRHGDARTLLAATVAAAACLLLRAGVVAAVGARRRAPTAGGS